jgi:hypothetical protein
MIMARVDADRLYADIEAALEKNAPAGMVGTFVIAAELYNEDGSVELHHLWSRRGTAWTVLGIIDVLSYAVQATLEPGDDGDE